ncbi:MAG: adenosylcobalamin-dependent ribonucleoside-diphosphate reductase [Pseudomonadota bacterium]
MSDKNTMADPILTPHARLILERRYLRRDVNRKIEETPAGMFERVARAVAQAEAGHGPASQVDVFAGLFHDLLASLDFLPNSPTLMNAGRELGQLAACFVLPIEDSIESIFNAIRDTALIHQSGGGTGFSFSAIRPVNDLVRSTQGASGGPISFMAVFDAATEAIKQGGVRRGANMGLLSVHHPDILDFIVLKKDAASLFANFNLSVAVTDKFMAAAAAGADYELINPQDGAVRGRLSASSVLDLIAAAAWASGDPGLVFIDRINRANNLPHLGEIEAVNPCGEQPLLPYESCTLGSINLARFAREGRVDYSRLAAVVKLAVRFLDDVIEVNRFPLPEIEKVSKRSRKIGLGVMGLADMLILLGRPYGADDTINFCGRLMAFIQKEAREASTHLAVERGNYPAFEESLQRRLGVPWMRNATVTTIAPTGTISIIAGCSSGIEPLYALAFRRGIVGGSDLLEISPLFRQLAEERGVWTKELARRVTETGSIRDVEGLPDVFYQLFATAHELDPLVHLKVQAAFQAHTDNAVSKTVNLPRAARPDEIRRIFEQADALGLKGVTVYRDGSKANQVLCVGPTWAAGAGNSCPECGSGLNLDNGRLQYPDYGFSRCG